MLYLVEWEHPEHGAGSEVVEGPTLRRGKLPADLWEYLAGWLVPASADTFRVFQYVPRKWSAGDGPNRASAAGSSFVGEYRRAVGCRTVRSIRYPHGSRPEVEELPDPVGAYPAEGGHVRAGALLVALVLAVLVLAACRPSATFSEPVRGCERIAGHADEDPDPPALRGADYVGGSPYGRWIGEDGRTIGYAAAEDSAVWSRPECVAGGRR